MSLLADPSRAIFQSALAPDLAETAADPLPRMRAVEGPWITVDDAYPAQLRLKAELLRTRPRDVLADRSSGIALRELVDVVRMALAEHPGFEVRGLQISCPDGRRVRLDYGRPLQSLSTVLQEDLCILEKRGSQHVLTAALLCFPASWTLAEKIGNPLVRIHKPVEEYDDGVTARVQRLFDGVQPGRPIWRANYLRYEDPTLYQPKREGAPRHREPDDAPFLRSERQTVLRLPRSGAVLFAIHTSVVAA